MDDEVSPKFWYICTRHITSEVFINTADVTSNTNLNPMSEVQNLGYISFERKDDYEGRSGEDLEGDNPTV